MLLLAAFCAAPAAWAAPLAEFSVTTGVPSGQPSSIKPGETTVLRITLINASGADYTGVNFNKALTPAGGGDLLVDGVATNTCGGTLTLSAVGDTLSAQLAGGTVPQSSNCTIDIPVKAASTNGAASTQTYTLGPTEVSMTGGDTNATGTGQGVTIQSVSRPTWSKGFGASAPAGAGGSATAILGGDPVYLTFRVVNPSGGVPLTGVEFEDIFPMEGGKAIIEPTGTAATLTNCGPGIAALTQGDNAKVEVSGVSVAVGQTCTISVPVRAYQTNGAYELVDQQNFLQQSSFDSDQKLTPSNSPTANITVRSPLGVTKTANPTRVASGGTGTFVITLSNSGTTALTVTSFNEANIDSGGVGGQRLTPTNITNSCGGTTLNADNTSGGGFQTGGYDIPAGGNCVLTVTFTGSTGAANTPLTFTNFIPQGAVSTAAGIVSRTRSAEVTIIDELYVDKSRSPEYVTPGGAVRYTVTISNFGSGAQTNVHLEDTLQNGSTFLTGGAYTPTLTPACGTLGNVPAQGVGAVDFIIPTLPAASGNTPGQCVVTFWAMTDPNGNGNTANQIPVCGVWHTAKAAGTCNGHTSNNVTATHQAPLLADKTFNGTNYQYPNGYNAASNTNYGGGVAIQTGNTQPEGTVVTMRIRLRNYSDSALTSVSVGDTLPISGTEQLQIATPANASTTCGGTLTATPGSTSLSLNGGTVPARADSSTNRPGMCVIQVDVVGPAGVYDNTANITAATQNLPNGGTQTLIPNTNTARLTYNGALSAVKSFEPTQITTDGKATVRIRLTNSDANAPITGISVTDPLPAAPNGLKLADPPNIYSTCAGSPVYSGAAGDASAGMAGASLPPSGSCDFLFDVVNNGGGGGNWTNTIPIGNITADGGIKNQSPVTATLTRVAAQIPTISKAIVPASVAPGETARLTISITNGTQALTGLAVTDHFTDDGLPGGVLSGIKIAATPNADTTCSGGSVTAVPGDTSVALSGAALAASTTCTVAVDVIATNPGAVGNTIPFNSISNDQGQTNTNTFAYAPLATSIGMGVAKAFSPNVVKPNERTRLRITFFNAEPAAVANFGITDNLPASMTVPAGPNVVQTCGPATLVDTSTPAIVAISGAAIGAASGGVSASCYVELDVVASANGKHTNTLLANSITINGVPTLYPPTPVPADLYAVDPIVVHKAIATFSLDTSGLPGGMSTGEASRAAGVAAPLLIHLENPNTVPLTGVAFTDVLPAGLVVAQTPNEGTTCTSGTVVAPASATSVRLAGASMAASSTCTVTVDVLSNNAGAYTNTIPAGGVTTTEGVTNEEPTRAKLNVATPPTVAKQFEPAVIPQNGTSTLTIFLGNDNASNITLTSIFTDTLPTAPGNIVVHGTPNASTTCGGAVTAVGGSGTVSLANGATIPAGGCTITVDVTGATPGAYNNNIPAGALKTNVGQNPDPANAPLQISTLGYISGKVFKDNNLSPNGTFESGTDTPIAGVNIELHSGATCGGALVDSTTTDASGNYLFFNLAAGTYSVCEPTQPSGTNNGTTTAGAINPVNSSTGTTGTASNPTSTTSQIVGIVLNGDGTGGAVSGSTGNNFAEIVPSSIAGTVFLDQNNNGAQNGPDVGIAGVTIELLDSGGTVIATTTTDADGRYRFDNLSPGTYSVRQPTQPADTANGITTAGAVGNGGTPGTATGPTTLPSEITGIVLPPNTVSNGNDFAEIPHGRTVSGRIFLDYNNNGLLDDPRDHGIGGQTVDLAGTDINGNPVTRQTTTASDGSYSFTGLPAGTYTVSQPGQPAGTTNGTTTAGTTGGAASNPSATTSQVLNLDLTGANTVSANNDFAEIPGPAPDLTIAKTHSPSSFAAGGTTGYYTVTASNIGLADTAGTVTVTDTLPVGITPTSASGTGWNCGIAGQVVTCTTTAVIAANGGAANPITLHVAVANGLEGQLLVNTAIVSGGGEPPGFDGNNRADDPTPIAGAGSPANLAGHVWHDANHDRVMDPGETKMPGWTVELLFNGVTVATTTTDASGAYAFTGLPPGSGYQVRFREPDSNSVYGMAVPNEQGVPFTNGVTDATNNPAGADNSDGTLSNLTLAAGANIVEQSLPLDPAGVVYDAVTRQPVAGAVVTLSGPGGFNPAVHVVGGNASVTTGASGFYQFLLFPAAPAGVYTLTVTAPAGYLPAPSTLIPACAATPVVGAAPDPALVQNVATAPGAGVASHDPTACDGIVGGGSATTQYFFSFDLTPGVSANVLNNHIPLDPLLGGAIVMTKTTPLVNVNRGDLVPYTVTATNTLAAALVNIDVVDRIPPGFRYRNGSATLDGLPAEPQANGRDLRWPNQTFAAGQRKTWKMVLVVGAGVGDGEYTNQAWSLNNVVNGRVSNIAGATVRVIPDPTFDCSEIIGTVFDDKNANGYQDQGEPGIANVRVVTARGLLVTTDAEGRFHVACAAIPQMDRGSNFVMKLDERTLPSGYRLTTENPRDVRVTRGKMVKLNFGATVHRVVRLELTAAAFGEGAELAPRWQAELEALPAKLKGRPSILRIAYRGDGDDGKGLARLDAVAARMAELWKKEAEKEGKEEEGGHPLVIETELEGAR